MRWCLLLGLSACSLVKYGVAPEEYVGADGVTQTTQPPTTIEHTGETPTEPTTPTDTSTPTTVTTPTPTTPTNTTEPNPTEIQLICDAVPETLFGNPCMKFEMQCGETKIIHADSYSNDYDSSYWGAAFVGQSFDTDFGETVISVVTEGFDEVIITVTACDAEYRAFVARINAVHDYCEAETVPGGVYNYWFDAPTISVNDDNFELVIESLGDKATNVEIKVECF